MRTGFLALLSSLLGLGGCQSCRDALTAPNARNCIASPVPCETGFYCNLTTERCEPKDCANEPAPCKIPEPCDQMMQGCVATSCVDQPSLCGPAESCEPQLKRCLPRLFALGQPDARTNLNTRLGLWHPVSAKFITDRAQQKLVVTDWGNSRTLIWNQVPTTNQAADVVLGQPDLDTTTQLGPYNGVNAGTLYAPWSVGSDGTQLLVADRYFNRILFFNPIPLMSGAGQPLAASSVWGQAGFGDAGANAGQQVNALGVSGPKLFVESPSGVFYIADYENHRILVFDRVPQSPDEAPRWVIGQPDFVTSAERFGPADLGLPYGLYSDGTQLFVADYKRNRVVGYNLPISKNYPTPDVLIGQADLSGTSYNRGGSAGRNGLAAPTDVCVVSVAGQRRVFIADLYNNRVVRYTLPSTSDADLVLGQLGYTQTERNRGGAISAATLYSPLSVDSDGTRLLIAEQDNHRVLIWNSLTLSLGQAADVIIGQPSANTGDFNLPALSALRYREISSVSSDGERLFASDQRAHRVLIWNHIPRSGDSAPDVVLGQRDFSSFAMNAEGRSASSLALPQGVHSDGTRLAVADTDNHRVLIWNRIPTMSFTPADVVLGQPDMNTSRDDQLPGGMDSPGCVYFFAGSLFVCDSGNHRVLRYDPPYSTGALPSLWLGQPDLTSNTPNNGGISARSLDFPMSITGEGEQLIIADSRNHRVLSWQRLPTVSFQPADVVTGSADFLGGSPSSVSRQTREPRGVHAQNGRLYVASPEQNRVLIWNQLPTQNGTPPDAVLGQMDFVSTLPNSQVLDAADRLNAPSGVAVVGGRIFIADQRNSRILSKEALPSR